MEDSRSRWEFWREATQPVREAIVLFSGGFDILCFSTLWQGWMVCLLRGATAPRQPPGRECKKASLVLG